MLTKLWSLSYFSQKEELATNEAVIQIQPLAPYVQDKLTMLDKLFRIHEQQFQNKDEVRQLCVTLLLIFKGRTATPNISLYSKDYENLQVKLHLEGPIMINVKNQQIPVEIEFQIDNSYPHMTPSIIINRSKINSDYKVNPYYSNYLQNDILLGKMLLQLRTWQDHRSIEKVVEEIQDLFAKHFPFVQYRAQVEKPELHEYSVEALDKLNDQNNSNVPKIIDISKGDSFEIVLMKEVKRGDGIIRPPITGRNNIYSTNGLDLNLYNSVQKEVREEINRQTTKIKKDIQIRKSEADEMIQIKERQIQSLEQNVLIQQQLDQSFQQLALTKQEIETIIKDNDPKITINRDNLEHFYKGEDLISEHIIEVRCSIKAARDSLRFLQKQFADGRSDLQQLMILTSKYSGMLFEYELLFKKYQTL